MSTPGSIYTSLRVTLPTQELQWSANAGYGIYGPQVTSYSDFSLITGGETIDVNIGSRGVATVTFQVGDTTPTLAVARINSDLNLAYSTMAAVYAYVDMYGQASLIDPASASVIVVDSPDYDSGSPNYNVVTGFPVMSRLATALTTVDMPQISMSGIPSDFMMGLTDPIDLPVGTGRLDFSFEFNGTDQFPSAPTLWVAWSRTTAPAQGEPPYQNNPLNLYIDTIGPKLLDDSALSGTLAIDMRPANAQFRPVFQEAPLLRAPTPPLVVPLWADRVRVAVVARGAVKLPITMSGTVTGSGT